MHSKTTIKDIHRWNDNIIESMVKLITEIFLSKHVAVIFLDIIFLPIVSHLQGRIALLAYG